MAVNARKPFVVLASVGVALQQVVVGGLRLTGLAELLIQSRTQLLQRKPLRTVQPPAMDMAEYS